MLQFINRTKINIYIYIDGGYAMHEKINKFDSVTYD